MISIGSNSRASPSSAIPNSICITCGEHDAIEKVHAAGAFHASKSKLNSEHVIKLTNNWRGTGVYIGDNALVNSLLVLTAHFTTKVVQLTYTINLPKSRRM